MARRRYVKLVADLEGKAHNTTDWLKRLSAQTTSAETLAANLKIAQTKDKLEMQAILDKKFRKVAPPLP